jgi:hypothetical protein
MRKKLEKLTKPELLVVEILVFLLEYRQFIRQFPVWFRSLFVACSTSIYILCILPVHPSSFVIAFGAGFAISINLKATINLVKLSKFN